MVRKKETSRLRLVQLIGAAETLEDSERQDGAREEGDRHLPLAAQ